GDGTISSYGIGRGGEIELAEAVAASTRLGEAGIRDEAISSNGRFLYALDADAQKVHGWDVGADGRLAEIGAFEGLPPTVAGHVEHDASYLVAFCDGGYTTNLPLEHVTDGKAWVAYGYDGEPLEPEHGGPARLLVPHLYFWKSAKWIRGFRLQDEDEPGFWES